MQLTRKFPKQAFDPISADGSPESLPYHNTNPAAIRVSPANHYIKQGGRDTMTMLLGIFDIAATFQEQIPAISTV